MHKLAGGGQLDQQKQVDYEHEVEQTFQQTSEVTVNL